MIILFLTKQATIFLKEQIFKNYPENNVFNISHSNINIPNNVIALSLNYSYHLRATEKYPIVYPLAYPFLYKKIYKKNFEDRQYKNIIYWEILPF